MHARRIVHRCMLLPTGRQAALPPNLTRSREASPPHGEAIWKFFPVTGGGQLKNFPTSRGETE
jgi:hypothetical protein